MTTPRLLITLGDVAGIGPEIIVKAWPSLVGLCRPIVVGDVGWLRWAQKLVGWSGTIVPIARVAEAAPKADVIPCLQASEQDLRSVVPGTVSAAAGRGAYDFLCLAIDAARAGQVDGIVTAPLHKEGLHAAGIDYPGHTEILAARTGTHHFGMMLYVRGPQVPHGLGVLHVTLHQALRTVFEHITTQAVVEKIGLLHGIMRKLTDGEPRLAVAALNPHAGDGGLFGDEESEVLVPAVTLAKSQGIQVSGPWPSDNLFVRAVRGEFDGIVAMYHDQGHIPLKLLGGLHCVNVSVGLPIVRTSVAHGTAYDIAGKGQADPTSMIEAVRVAVRLVSLPA